MAIVMEIENVQIWITLRKSTHTSIYNEHNVASCTHH